MRAGLSWAPSRVWGQLAVGPGAGWSIGVFAGKAPLGSVQSRTL